MAISYSFSSHIADPLAPVEWHVSREPQDYVAALADMVDRAGAIRDSGAGERIWLLEHPPLYTAGTSARAEDVLDARFPVHVAGRGGQYTYHGPDQRIVYLNLDIARRGRDVRRLVQAMEGWMIAALGDLGVASRRAEGRIGIWTDTPTGAEAKIGAIGIRLKRWVTLHGLSINVAPDLAHFGGIIPCGIRDYGVTSLAALGNPATMADLDAALLARAPAFLSALGEADEPER